jgi:hypothetical protein
LHVPWNAHHSTKQLQNVLCKNVLASSQERENCNIYIYKYIKDNPVHVALTCIGSGEGWGLLSYYTNL